MLRIPGRSIRTFPVGDPGWRCGTVGDGTDPDEALFMGGPMGTDPIVTVFGASDAPPPPKGQAREQWARQAVVDGWQKAHPGDQPSLSELQAVQAVSRLESGYGSWGNHPKCGNNGVGSNNWGSVQACVPCLEGEKKNSCCKVRNGECPDGTFLCGDYDAAHNYNYAVCFYKYPTPADGAASVINHMTTHRPKTWAAIKTGDAVAISTAMYDEHYYGGFGKTREDRIEGHVKALTGAAEKIATALGEPLVVKRGGAGGGDGLLGSGSDGSSWGTVAFIGAVAAAVAGGVYLANK